MEISTITTPFVFNISVNCYLVKTGGGYILIDTGRGGKRTSIENALGGAGCQRGALQLIILTHGDFDHSGNAAYLRDKFETKIAMHYDDLGMVEQGDMTWNRKKPNVVVRALFSLLIRLGDSDRFTADTFLKEGDDLSEYGFEATVLELPGHSKGSIGLLTSAGDLFCGDLLGNQNKPELWSIIDDPIAAATSLEKLRGLDIETVYPGHGKPFTMEQLYQNVELMDDR
jgi:glyoxylase-like metal-dependent hydrolase (beta-lactamase superfamily II)